jgi:hypothetical protein
MKKLLFVLIALLTMVAFVSGASAQKAGKSTPKAMFVTGTVAAYEAGKTITVKGTKDVEQTFVVTAETTVTPTEVKAGDKVKVQYKKDGEKMVATAITAVVEKAKPKAKTK